MFVVRRTDGKEKTITNVMSVKRMKLSVWWNLSSGLAYWLTYIFLFSYLLIQLPHVHNVYFSLVLIFVCLGRHIIFYCLLSIVFFLFSFFSQHFVLSFFFYLWWIVCRCLLLYRLKRINKKKNSRKYKEKPDSMFVFANVSRNLKKMKREMF